MEFSVISKDVEENITYNIQEKYSKFNGMRKNGMFCDIKGITTSVNGNEVQFDAHRMILDANIPYFSSQLSFESEKEVCFLALMLMFFYCVSV